MKKMMMIAAGIGMAALSQAAALNWGTGTAYFTNPDATRVSGGLVQLMVWDGDSFEALDSGLTSTVSGSKGTFSNTWGAGEGYLVANFAAGTQFYYRAFGTGIYAGISANLYANGKDALTPTYWTLSSVADTDGAQTLFLSDNGYAGAITVPEPTSMALLALGVAALGLRRKFRK